MDPEDKALLAYIVQLLLALSGEPQVPGDVSTEPGKWGTWDIAQTIKAYLQDPTDGLAAATDQRNLLYGAVNLLQINTADPHPATLTDILAAIGNVNPVTLPTTPPSGYGGTVIGMINVPQICGLD